jgi:hypothetical protein
MTEKQLNYLRIINKQFKSGNITNKEFKKELKWFRKTVKRGS